MTGIDLGGDPPCWAHIFDDRADDQSGADPNVEGGLLVVDLGVDAGGSGGAVWSLPHGGDLDANLVRLDPGTGIEAHVNGDLDVLVLVQSGTAELTVDGKAGSLAAGHLALIPKGSQRSITAGTDGVTYLSVHQQRSPLAIKKKRDHGAGS